MTRGFLADKAGPVIDGRRPRRRWPTSPGKGSMPTLAVIVLAVWHLATPLFAAPSMSPNVDQAAAKLARIRAAPDPSPGREFLADKEFFSAGQVLNGTVKRVLDKGIIIRITPEFEGFAHVSKLRDGYVGHPSEVVEEGEKVTCRVLRHGPKFFELTLREIGNKDLLRDFKFGQKLEGTVVAVCNAGADVNIGAAKYAFLHKSQIADGKPVADAREYLKKGDKVKAWVKSQDFKAKTLKLTMIESQLERKAIAQGLKLEKLMPGDELGGQVTSVMPFGVFVKVGAESDGLLHIKRVNDGIVTDLTKLFQRGDMVVVRVFAINRGKLELELVGAPLRLPSVDGFEPLKGETVDAKVIQRVPEAFLVSVTPPEGGSSVLAKLPATAGMDLAEGDVTKVKIMDVDVSRRQLSLLDPLLGPAPPAPGAAPGADGESRSYGNL